MHRPQPGHMGDAVSDMPLAVDMDGTLILSDMSWISIYKVIFRKPWLIPSVLFKELTGKRARWKRDLAEKLSFNPADLKYHEIFLEWITGEYARGRTLILATASDRIVAEQVAAHVGLFSDVMASDGDYNLRGQQKADSLIARFGEEKFGYAGNSHHDIDVWKHSGQVIVVNPENGLLDKIGDSADVIFE
jgi:beta-phosphoglucomutase-like phosphatase (HAD superfamily)